MLLELLEHHEDLLSAVINILLENQYKCMYTDIVPLLYCCKTIREFIILKYPLLQNTIIHIYKIQPVLKDIKAIKIIGNETISFKYHNNKLVRYYYCSFADANNLSYRNSNYFSAYNFDMQKRYALFHSITGIEIHDEFYIPHSYVKVNEDMPQWLKKYVDNALFKIYVNTPTIEWHTPITQQSPQI
jgi:hypothetical protein